MYKILTLFLIVTSTVIVENYVVEVPESEDNGDERLKESAVQFMLQWAIKNKDPFDIPEVSKPSNTSMVEDLFMRFNNTKMTTQLAKFHEDNNKPTSVTSMRFSQLKLKDGLLHSEVRYFRECEKIPPGFNKINNNITVVVFEVKGLQRKFINSTFLPGECKTGWFGIDVTDLYKNWIDFPEENQGIQAVINLFGKYTFAALEVAGIAGFEEDKKKRPFLASFFDSRPKTEQYFDDIFWNRFMASAQKVYDSKHRINV